MPAKRERPFTLEEDQMILEASAYGALRKVAESLELPLKPIRTRRNALLRRIREKRKKERVIIPSFSPRFARPSFFKEDLSSLIQPHSTVGRIASYAKE